MEPDAERLLLPPGSRLKGRWTGADLRRLGWEPVGQGVLGADDEEGEPGVGRHAGLDGRRRRLRENRRRAGGVPNGSGTGLEGAGSPPRLILLPLPLFCRVVVPALGLLANVGAGFLLVVFFFLVRLVVDFLVTAFFLGCRVAFCIAGPLDFFGRPAARFFLAAAALLRRVGALAMVERPWASFRRAPSEGLKIPFLERVTGAMFVNVERKEKDKYRNPAKTLCNAMDYRGKENTQERMVDTYLYSELVQGLDCKMWSYFLCSTHRIKG